MNGAVGFVAESADTVTAVVACNVVDGQILAIRSVLNPDKLTAIPWTRYRPGP